MSFLRKPVLLVALLLGLTSFSQCQQAYECEKPLVAVNVRDHEGNLVAGLSLPSFRAKMHGQTVTVSSANVGKPPRIVLLLDASGSMTSPKLKWEVARLAIENMVTSTRGNTSLALVFFANDVLDTLDFRRSPEEILRKIEQSGDAEKLVPHGKGGDSAAGRRSSGLEFIQDT
jgi:hypothetical protein